MSNLKSLKFTAVPKVENNPALNRRRTLIERLEEQKLLIDNPAYTRIVQSWTKKDGDKVLVEKRLKLHPWWRIDENGVIILFVKHGWKRIEFEKGKAGIVVGAKDKLPGVIDTLIGAIRAGELDPILEQAKTARPAPKKKAA